MFENLQDTILLRYSLESAANSVISNEVQKNLCDLEDDNLEIAVNIVYETVNRIITFNVSQDKNRVFEISLSTNRRLHAAIFYSVLRSCEITSKDAENFYSSIHSIFPPMNWKFYIQLNKRCCWSEYFIECALQLPSLVLAEILKIMLGLASEKKNQCYIWHMVLQVLILKRFSKMPSCKDDLPFNFQYTIQDSIHSMKANPKKNRLLHCDKSKHLIDSSIDLSIVELRNPDVLQSNITVSSVIANSFPDGRSSTVETDNPNESVKSDLTTHITDDFVNVVSSVEGLDINVLDKPCQPVSNAELSVPVGITVTGDSLKKISENHSISNASANSGGNISDKGPLVDLHNSSDQKYIYKDFVDNEQTVDNDSIGDLVKVLVNLCEVLYSNVYCIKECELESIHFVKVLLHAWMTLCRMLNDINCEDEFIRICNILKEFNLLYDLLKDSLVQDSCQRSIVSSFSAPDYSACNYLYVTTSWEIDMIYLTFVLLNNWKGILSKEFKKIPVEDCDSSFYCKIKDGHVYELLENLNQLDKNCLMLTGDFYKHISILTNIIKYSYPCSVEAARILLSHPDIFERNEVLSVIEDNLSSQNIEHLYSAFIKSVRLASSQESRIRLLKAFFHLLSQSPSKIYNTVLEKILISCGETDQFKLPDFNSHIAQFLRKTLSVQEAETIVLPLFVQSPKEVLKCVVQQAVLLGAGGNALIQILKYVPVVCHYQKHKEGISSLIEELLNYFAKDDLKRTEEKSILNLIKVLVEVQIEEEIFCVDMLFAKCLIPILSSDDASERRNHLNLERLNIILKTLFQKKALKISSETLMLLVKCLFYIMHISIDSSNGKLKEWAVTSLCILKDYEKEAKTLNDTHKSSLQAEFSRFNSAVNLYVSEFLQLPIDLNGLSSHHLWIWCCNTKDTSIVKDKFTVLSYVDIVNILIQVLPHFTKDEWLHSSFLMNICFKESMVKDLPCLPFKGSKSDEHAYIIVSCFLESLHFLLQNYDVNFFQVCVHLSNTIMKILLGEKKIGSSLLTTAHLDLCFFASDPKLRGMAVFTSLLLELKKKILSNCTDEISKQEFRKILASAMTRLRHSAEDAPSQINELD